MTEPELEQFLARLEGALRGLRRRERERALREARDHVLCAADEGRPLRSAIEAFGAVESVAAGYARPARRRGEKLTVLAVGVTAVIAALAIGPPGGLLSTSRAADSECAGRWNAHPGVAGYSLAWVSTARPSCEVVLHDGRGARVFRQRAAEDRWHVITSGRRTLWPLARIPAAVTEHAYLVTPDGSIGRRISAG